MKIYFILFVQFVHTFAQKNDVPFVFIEDGALIGSYRQTLEGKPYAAFEGIPYAAPPLEDLRFMPPQPVPQWSGFRSSTLVKNICPQVKSGAILGDEDCLYLNVFVPEPAFTQRSNEISQLNVLVYIHGGAFAYFSGNTAGPQYLFDYSDDIILVTFNYRLGILGFMSLGDEIIPGNNGLKDQVAVLKWVQKNIHFFGGSADKVTLAGLSAGGASVHLHMLSTMSKGLFQKAISASGTALNPGAISTNVTAKSLEVVSTLGCPTSDSKIILRCLQRLPFQSIAAAIIPYYTFGRTPTTPFGPVVEPCIPDAFISTHPLYLMTQSQEVSVPWLLTMNRNEGLYPGAEIINNATLMTDLSLNWVTRFEPLLDLGYVISSDIMTYVTTKIKEYYFDDQTVGFGNLHILIKMLTERLFLNGIEMSAKLHASKCNNTVYMYIFNYRGDHSTTEYFTNTSTDFGVSHGDDTLYVIFDSALLPFENQTSSDREMTNAISNIWISFIRTGNPKRGNFDWPALSCKQEKLTFLSIYSPFYAVVKDTATVGSQPFWDSLPFSPFAGYNTFCYTFNSYDLPNHIDHIK